MKTARAAATADRGTTGSGLSLALQLDFVDHQRIGQS
jgi:hypothetical protein